MKQRGLSMCVRVFLSTILLASLIEKAGAAERLAIEAPLVSPQTQEAASTVNDLLDRATRALGRLYGSSIEAVGSGGDAQFSLATVVSLSSDGTALVITMTRIRDDLKTAPLSWFGPATTDQTLWLTRAIFLLWSSFHGFLADQASEPAVFVDELPIALIHPLLVPQGLAIKPNGNIVAALGLSSVELDPNFKPVDEPGKALGDKGVLNYATGVSSTPSGSLLLKPGGGRDLYRIMPDIAEAQRLPAGLELGSIFYWTALADGSALLVDSNNRKAFRVSAGRKRQELPLFENPSSWPTSYAAGPDGSIWMFDPIMRGIRILTADGADADLLLPLVDPSEMLAPTAMSVGPDGSFVMLSNKRLYKFHGDGRPVWRADTIAGSEQDSFPAQAPIAVDWTRGLIYVADMTNRRIIKLLDRDYARDKKTGNDMEEKLIALRARRATDEVASLAEAAGLYETAGSSIMAKSYWQKVQDADPGNEKAEARLFAIDLAEMKREAAELDAKARETLRTIGIESARGSSVLAIQKYELILSKAPDDQHTRKAMSDLKDLFSEKGTGGEQKKPLSIPEVKLANLFPSLMQYYATHTVGTVTVKNTLAQAADNLRASVLIPRFMDFPTDAPVVATLAPGASASFDLKLSLNRTILDLQEDMTVQARIDVAYVAAGTEQTVSRIVNATIYRNTALRWDDSRKIASFITPNEETVSGFAHRVLDTGGAEKRARLSAKLFQAMRICDALGTYGINYVEDPDSPISKALGKNELVDTVRFPRATLSNRAGDCDDTTALLGSLLESIGVRTAIVTTPGHIFLAFDSGEPSENAQFLSTKSLEVIPRGTTWIPVETTVLSKGFMAAWSAASELVRKYRANGPFEFIPLAEMRDSYPALPLPPSSITVVEPAKTGVDRMFSSSLAGFTSTLYTARLAELAAQLKGLSGKQAVKARVQEGILHALFGKMVEAESAFTKAIADDPTMISPYVNLANVKLLAANTSGALEIVRQGLSRNANSALLNLLAARIYSDTGDAARAQEHFAKVKTAAPELAARYADLVGAGAGGAQRAGQTDGKPSMIWGGEE